MVISSSKCKESQLNSCDKFESGDLLDELVGSSATTVGVTAKVKLVALPYFLILISLRVSPSSSV